MMMMQTAGRLRTWLEYRRQFANRLGIPTETDEPLNRELSGYPRNHIYHINKGEIIPSFRLFERSQILRPFLEESDRFLDIGCCRGYYVCRQAASDNCRQAVGIDLHRKFVNVSNKVRSHLQLGRAAFYYASITDVSADPTQFLGPFDIVLLIGTYHYLFWGSELNSRAYLDHYTIFSALRKICTKHLLVSGRLDRKHLPRRLQAQAAVSRRGIGYNTETFLATARHFFDVRQISSLGRYPLYLMTVAKE